MLSKLRETIDKNKMLASGDKVVCALSGGADSMAMIYGLYQMKKELGIEIYAAHLNHSIRGEEADKDEEFVKDFCNNLGIGIFVKKVDIPKISKEKGLGEEECGRNERYKFFDDVLRQIGQGKIATAHHMGDNSETVLFNLFRGSGSRGLGGIPYKRDNIIRPMLDVTKDEITGYLKKEGIEWREDSTNRDTLYARNKIRLSVLKEAEKIFPEAVKKINSAAASIRRDDEYLTALAKESGAFDNGAILTEKFLPLHESLKTRVVLEAFKEWGVEPSLERINAVCDIALLQTGKMRDVGNGVAALNQYGKILKTENKKKDPAFYEHKISVGENVCITAPDGVWEIKTVDKKEKMRDNKMMIVLDADELGEELSVRTRREGDRISPYGMEGEKKLKKVFIDLKIPVQKRDMISMLTKGDEALFIPGIRKTKNYLPKYSTERFFVACYRRNEKGGTNDEK